MTEGLKKALKKWGVYFGSFSGFIAVTAILVGLYTLQSDVANLKRNDHKQDLLIIQAVNAAHEKELACKDMENQLVITRMSFKSKGACKDGT